MFAWNKRRKTVFPYNCCCLDVVLVMFLKPLGFLDWCLHKLILPMEVSPKWPKRNVEPFHPQPKATPMPMRWKFKEPLLSYQVMYTSSLTQKKKSPFRIKSRPLAPWCSSWWLRIPRFRWNPAAGEKSCWTRPPANHPFWGRFINIVQPPKKKKKKNTISKILQFWWG